jgi:YHS domain-containing protein
MSILLRFVLEVVVLMLVLRAAWRMVSNLIGGATSSGPRRSSGPPDRGVLMVRDPVCGTFLPPSGALSLTERNGAVRYFCSEKCRTAFKARA